MNLNRWVFTGPKPRLYAAAMWKIWVGVFGALAAFGCGSSDSTPLPVQQCNTFLSDYCGHASDCFVVDGIDTANNRNADDDLCLATARRGLDCNKAVSVGPTYQACIMDVNTTECSTFASAAQGMAPPLPADCVGVIMLSP